MTDTQLYFAIGIPAAFFALNFIGVLGAAFWQSKRFEDMRDVFRAEIAGLRAENSGEIKTLRVELGGKIDNLAVRVKALEDEIHSPLVKR